MINLVNALGEKTGGGKEPSAVRPKGRRFSLGRDERPPRQSEADRAAQAGAQARADDDGDPAAQSRRLRAERAVAAVAENCAIRLSRGDGSIDGSGDGKKKPRLGMRLKRNSAIDTPGTSRRSSAEKDPGS
eukprot:2053058-Prymnesium_polylepis.1